MTLSPRGRNWLAWLLPAALVAVAGWLVAGHGAAPPEPAAGYVGSQTCATCHAKQAASWAGSHHALAMCPATPDTVRGNFDNQEFKHQGTTSRFFRDGDQFRVTTEGPDGQPATYPIPYTFGWQPLQQYLIDFPGGRMQALSVAWDTEKKRWFHLYPNEKIPPGDWLHWTKAGQNWNYMCADCHSTGLLKNYDLASDSYHTTSAESSVGCEACHGPGQAHVAWARKGDSYADGTAHGLAPLRYTRTEIDACAACHARRGLIQAGFQPGQELLDYFAPELLDTNNYFDDGQIREEVYEYGSFLQSKMFRAGVHCGNCHDPHSAKLVAPGNSLCVRCHPTFDRWDHHRHPAGSAGAQCVECHMPSRTYMVVHARRDHSIRVPRPDLTISLGTPNACNGCHKDKSPEWARDQVTTWFRRVRPGDPEYAPAFAAGKAGKPEGEPLLKAILERQNAGPLLRATAASLLGHYSTSKAALAGALLDREPLVRAAAVRGLEGQPPDELRRTLTPLLQDPVRLVRTEAARVLSQVPLSRLSRDEQQEFMKALNEYEQVQMVTAEQPAAHHNLGVVFGNLGEQSRAEAEYQTALRLNPEFVPARFNLAMLHYQRQDLSAAERGLRVVIARSPQMAEAHYSLGLLLAEDPRRLSEAAEVLATAAKLAPRRARVQYNYGLALQRLGRPAEAEAALKAAHLLEPAATDYLYALAVLNMQQQRRSEADRWLDELLRRAPNHAEGQALRESLRR